MLAGPLAAHPTTYNFQNEFLHYNTTTQMANVREKSELVLKYFLNTPPVSSVDFSTFFIGHI